MARPLGSVAVLLALCAAVVVVDPGGGRASTALAAETPAEEAQQVVAHYQALRQNIDAWLAQGEPPVSPPPDQVMSEALFLQQEVRSLARRARGDAERVIFAIGAAPAQPPGGPAQPVALAADVRGLVAAARKLRALSKGSRNRNLKTGEPPPLSELVSHYREAKRRLGIHPRFLAAIHHVETKFGRVKSGSVAGARGPMQFIPSTWRIYGRGGDIDDPDDAIIAAARLLRDRGAPRSYGRALFAYNPSKLYVAAVSLYAKLIARNPHALYFLYCWSP